MGSCCPKEHDPKKLLSTAPTPTPGPTSTEPEQEKPPLLAPTPAPTSTEPEHEKPPLTVPTALPTSMELEQEKPPTMPVSALTSTEPEQEPAAPAPTSMKPEQEKPPAAAATSTSTKPEQEKLPAAAATEPAAPAPTSTKPEQEKPPAAAATSTSTKPEQEKLPATVATPTSMKPEQEKPPAEAPTPTSTKPEQEKPQAAAPTPTSTKPAQEKPPLAPTPVPTSTEPEQENPPAATPLQPPFQTLHPKSPPSGQTSPFPPPTVEECISLFETINNVGDLDYLIDLIDELWQSLLNITKEEKTSKRSTTSETSSDTLKDKTNSVWTSLLRSGSLFLEFVNNNIQLEKGEEGNTQAVTQILQRVGKMHWAVGGLSVVAFLLDQIGQISENRSECIELLRQMFKLAGHIRKLKYDMPQEDTILSDAIILIVEGSMMCASQLKCRTLFGFLKASANSETLGTLQLKINQLYQDLTLRVVIEIQHQQPVAFSPWKPIYPDYAVGIQEQKKQVMKLLDMETETEFSLAVVIYGFGGIGKTTLATAVIADLDLTDYNYSGVQIQEDRSRDDIKYMQEQILKDAFPAYTYGRNVTLRNSAEGRDHLTSAFRAQGNKPVFLFIDHALRAEDLQELFPERLADLPKRSRILVTTRNLGVTDMLKHAGLARREHCVGTLPDQEAIKILLRDSNPDNILDTDKLRKTLKICAGIPLVLEIVGARLRKQNYMIERCTQIFEALERGQDIRGENLSQRLVTFVYNELEASMQEAFLDICCFFANWNRHDVECIVGAEEVTHLEEAALIKTSDEGKMIVHDIIRAKGLNMCESNRIMDMPSWLDVCDNQRLDQIKGVWLSREESEPGYELDEKHIVSMKKSLRVLALGNQIKVLRSSEKTPKFKELRFLRLGGDISGLWPANLESLERLAVFHGPVFKDGVTLYQLPKRLRVMKATTQSQESANSRESKPTKVIQNSFLEELDLNELKSFQRLPERLDHLSALKVLILDEWDKMQELPEQVCGLRSLCKLSICGGSSLKNLPKSFEQLCCLEELILTSCKQLEQLPSTFGELRSLKHLNVAECVNLKELPSSFGKLISLEVLNLERCWKLEALPSSFGELSSLAELRCNSLELKELPNSFGQLSSLRHLDLSSCANLRTLPSSVGELRSLKSFNLLACFKLEELPSKIGELPCLTQLDLSGCNSLREFSGSRQTNQELTIRLPDHLRDRESSSNQMSRSLKH